MWLVDKAGQRSTIGLTGEFRVHAGDKVLTWALAQPPGLRSMTAAERTGAIAEEQVQPQGRSKAGSPWATQMTDGYLSVRACGDAQYGMQKTGLHELRLYPMLADDAASDRSNVMAGKVVFALEGGKWSMSWPVHRFGGQKWYVNTHELHEELEAVRRERSVMCWQKPGMQAVLEDWRGHGATGGNDGVQAQ